MPLKRSPRRNHAALESSSCSAPNSMPSNQRYQYMMTDGNAEWFLVRWRILRRPSSMSTNTYTTRKRGGDHCEEIACHGDPGVVSDKREPSLAGIRRPLGASLTPANVLQREFVPAAESQLSFAHTLLTPCRPVGPSRFRRHQSGSTPVRATIYPLNSFECREAAKTFFRENRAHYTNVTIGGLTRHSRPRGVTIRRAVKPASSRAWTPAPPCAFFRGCTLKLSASWWSQAPRCEFLRLTGFLAYAAKLL